MSTSKEMSNPVGALFAGLLIGGLILLCGWNSPPDKLEFDGHSVAPDDYCYDLSFDDEYRESDSNRCSEVANVVEDRSGTRAFIKFIGFAVIAIGIIASIGTAVGEASGRSKPPYRP